MAQFIEKTDYFGLGDGTMLVCTTADEGKSVSLAEVHNSDGSFIEHNVYGETRSPSNNYVMKATTFEKAAGDIKLGAITNVEVDTNISASICLGTLNINTQAGSAPSFDASGEQVEDGAEAECTYSLPAITLPKQHHAFILLSCLSSENYGNGIYLQSAGYSFSSSISKATKDGVCLTHDVTEGKIEASLQFVSTTGVEPTIAPGTDWFVSTVPSISNPDSDWPTYSVTLTKYLVKD